jgi:hypothetical protein
LIQTFFDVDKKFILDLYEGFYGIIFHTKSCLNVDTRSFSKSCLNVDTSLPDDLYYIIDGGYSIQPFPAYKQGQILTRDQQRSLRKNIRSYQEEIDKCKLGLIQVRNKQREDAKERIRTGKGELLTIAQVKNKKTKFRMKPL